jgi:hypothetical protein
MNAAGAHPQFIPDSEETFIPVLVNNARGDGLHDLTSRLGPVGTGKAEGAFSRQRGEFPEIQHEILRGNPVRLKTPDPGSINEEAKSFKAVPVFPLYIRGIRGRFPVLEEFPGGRKFQQFRHGGSMVSPVIFFVDGADSKPEFRDQGFNKA